MPNALLYNKYAKKDQKILRTTKLLPQKYVIQNREQNKVNFITGNYLPFNVSKRTLIIGMSLSDKEDTPENMIKEEVILALEAEKIQTIVIGKNPHLRPMRYIQFLPKNELQNVEKIADIFIYPEENKELEIMHHGTICISKTNTHVQDYTAQNETGNGYTCLAKNHWQLFAQIIRASEAYLFSYDWKHLCQNAMDASFLKL